MKVLSVLALVLFVGANSFAQNGAGTTGAGAAGGTAGAGAPSQQMNPATDSSGTATKSEKPMKKEHHKKKKSKKKAAAE